MSPKSVFLAVGLMLGFGGIAAAHHSNAAYDLDHPKTVEGTVKTVNWTNPHITFVIETDAKNAEPAIMDRALFDAVQQNRQENRQVASSSIDATGHAWHRSMPSRSRTALTRSGISGNGRRRKRERR